ncbi:ABC transporter ATP-binding protein [Actibacterium mucosum KCTC 23349]|uniref:ABC transporter ATP-binding protein n=1 Tax=Actibacterium mucosum KCTC 23349 TaxID=1454373 RepID=A0A037ZMJ1_9RHOB|nr:ABC transporter ATP-binding protein [Actibacterium mucosum]KAJ56026.1 ABC transporter ATP-binding protein [Actibacterium mucosum KCTC 23349]
MATVELSNLQKNFGAYTALENLNLCIEDGEFLVLLGPSGCGKSTTMRLVAGLEEPTSGDILIGGQRVNDMAARDRDLAMVFQNYALYPHMTVGENIGYPLKIARIPKAERANKVAEAAGKVEMDHLLTRRPAELSGGQRQRVALARAIVRRPQLFLMDEPLSNLDAKLRTVMRAELKHLQKELATTTIYVTHDQVEAMTLADRIVILNDARIQQMGTPAEIYARPANTFVASFIGSPPMNLITGTLAEGMFRHTAGQVAVDGAAGPVTLGIRPENISVSDTGDLTGTVYSSELLGDSTLLNIRVGDGLVAAKVGPDEGRAMGAPVGLTLNRAKLHLFDAETGDRRA